MVIACTDDLEVNKRILNCAEIDTSFIADTLNYARLLFRWYRDQEMWKLQFQQMENHPQRLKDCESFLKK
jgi:hypothetical protein